MANNAIHFINPHTGELRTAPVGYSWTVLFFGFFPPLIRSDWKWGLIMVIVAFPTFGLSGVVFSFLYNKLYVKELVQKGFKVKGVQTGTVADMSAKVGMTLDEASA